MSLGLTQTHISSSFLLLCGELMNLGNDRRQQMHFPVGERSHVSSTLLWVPTLRAMFLAAILYRMYQITTINDLEGQDPKTGKLPLAISGVLIAPISIQRGIGKGERKGGRSMEPLEHLVADLALHTILFLNLVQQEIYSHRENENCFSLSLSVVINMLAKATFSLQAKNVSYVQPGPTICIILPCPLKHIPWAPTPATVSRPPHCICPAKGRKAVFKYHTEGSGLESHPEYMHQSIITQAIIMLPGWFRDLIPKGGFNQM